MNLEEAILSALTDRPMNTYEVARARLLAQGEEYSAAIHGTAATLTCLVRLQREGKVRLTRNKNGASCWSLA